MNKYKVKVIHIFSEIFDVESENKDEAKEKVKEIFNQENFETKPQYENTVPPEHWAVISEEEFQEMIKNIETELSKEQNSESEIAK